MASLNDLIRMQQGMDRLAADKRVSPELRGEARRQAGNLAKIIRVRRQRDFFDHALGAGKARSGSLPTENKVTLPITLALTDDD